MLRVHPRDKKMFVLTLNYLKAGGKVNDAVRRLCARNDIDADELAQKIQEKLAAERDPQFAAIRQDLVRAHLVSY